MSDFSPRLGSTYRLQLHGVGFAGARSLVGYLHDLGIETLYLSPILRAVAGSTHGYDVIDPTCLDPALGTPAEFELLLQELDRHGMRVLIDIVPNHMAAAMSNPWWWDVLRRGPASPHARTFDIDWDAYDDRVLVPTLSAPLQEVLEDAPPEVLSRGDELVLCLDHQEFPLEPHPAPFPVASSPIDWHALLLRQHYIPAYWRLSNDEGNYRRFFDIDGLVGVRVEDPDVFESTHAFIVQLCGDPRVAGVRADHVDGLADPARYLRQLGAALREAGRDTTVVLIEKILCGDEIVPADWETDGTTGYEFGAWATGLFVDPQGARVLRALPMTPVDADGAFTAVGREAKRQAVRTSFGAAVRSVTNLVWAALEAESPGHDLSHRAIQEAITELTVQLDVYRTYIDEGPLAGTDRVRLRRCRDEARVHLAGEAARAVGLVADALMAGAAERAEPPGPATPPWQAVAVRWQQLTGAVMAKGVEDTATYRYAGLLSQVDVGADPDEPAVSPTEFVAAVARRGRTFPAALNATSTHDAKRSEDVRCRLAVLSETPDHWAALVERWERAHDTLAKPLARSDQLFTYQILAGVWPFDDHHLDTSALRRVADYLVKSVREAKVRSSWASPDQHYEEAVVTFVQRLGQSDGLAFGEDMRQLIARIGPAGASNALALTVLKCISPGTPDIYQGCELWNFSLTDPDNRRPVDFARRRTFLGDFPSAAERLVGSTALLERWTTGEIKQYVTHALLTRRRALSDLFWHGTCDLAPPGGSGARCLVSVLRHWQDQWMLAIVPRRTLRQTPAGRFAIGEEVWADTYVELPAEAPTSYVDLLTGLEVTAHNGCMALATALAHLPVAVLVATPTRAENSDVGEEGVTLLPHHQ